jgi:addiction module HigA family antidote
MVAFRPYIRRKPSTGYTRELGRRLDVQPDRITAIINGQRSIAGDTALRLGHFFGNGPRFWLNLQAIYDLCTAEDAVGKKIHALPTLSVYTSPHLLNSRGVNGDALIARLTS